MYQHYTESFVKQVLNENGEIVPERFTKDNAYKKNGKQGWVKMYKNGYDEVMMSLKSDLEKNIFIKIRDMFTKNQDEVSISQTDLASIFKTTSPTVNRFMKKMEQIGFLFKVRKGVYRMNPYILTPYQSETQRLQDDWDKLIKEQIDIER